MSNTALAKHDEPQALQETPATQVISMIERMASDPNVDVDKLERLIAMQERVMAHNAKAAFDEAFAQMLAEIPAVVADKRGDKWMYAPLDQIISAVRPVMAKHGFSLSHRTEWPAADMVQVVGILAHRLGHERESTFQSAADKSGSKNAVQALGSAVQYGRRYTTKDLLCIVTVNEDDDAQRTAKRKAEDAPDGYNDWLITLSAKADESLTALQQMWATANGDKDLKAFSRYLTTRETDVWNDLKRRAAKAGAK